MLLSEAIRLGAMQGPQIHGRFLGLNHSSCALGAAAISIGVSSPNTLNTAFPGLKREITATVQPYSPTSGSLQSAIVFLNDYLFRSRQEIADWIVANNYDCESVALTTNVEQPEEAVCV